MNEPEKPEHSQSTPDPAEPRRKRRRKKASRLERMAAEVQQQKVCLCCHTQGMLPVAAACPGQVPLLPPDDTPPSRDSYRIGKPKTMFVTPRAIIHPCCRQLPKKLGLRQRRLQLSIDNR